MNLLEFNKMMQDSFGIHIYDCKLKKRVYLVHSHCYGELKNMNYYISTCTYEELKRNKYMVGYSLSIQEALSRIKPIMRC